MRIRTLLRRSMTFHRRGNLAVLLGVAVGTAVITGALLVGDSLRGSLQDRALLQLGGVESALVGGRFLQSSSVNEIGSDVHYGIHLRGSLVKAGDETRSPVQLGGVDIWTIPPLNFADARIGKPSFAARLWGNIAGRPAAILHTIQVNAPPSNIVLLSPAVANVLDAKEGDQLTLQIARPSGIPRESLLGRREAEQVVQRLNVKVTGLLADDDPLNSFSLTPGIQQPKNVFVHLEWLANEIGEPNRVNVVVSSDRSASELQTQLRERLTLSDWGLILHTPAERTAALLSRFDSNKDGKLEQREWNKNLPAVTVQAADADGDKTITRNELVDHYRRRGFFALESRSMFIEPAVERTALQIAKESGLQAGPTMVYLANAIEAGAKSIPYSVVAALDPSMRPPLGPFLPDAPGAAASAPLADDEIVLAEWTKSHLDAKPGDTITLTYFDPNQGGQTRELTAKFRLRGYVPMSGVASDPDLTPDFPGITDRVSLREWNPPFELTRKIGDDDEKYWADYRTTPKAYITLEAGRKLFGSRFGELTSIRLAPPSGSDLEKAAQQYGERLLKSLKLEQGGFVFENVRERAIQASSGGMDFGMLFLGFSFFLIAAAMLLVGLLVRLALDRRSSEIGLLLATGFRVSIVRKLLLSEGLILSAIGALLGLVLAIGYAALMLRLLAALWPEGSVGSFLRLHVGSPSLAIGYTSAMVVSALTIWWALRTLRRVVPSALLAGATRSDDELQAVRPKRWRRWLVVALGIVGVALIAGGGFVRNAEARAGTFFTGGMLLLVVALCAVRAWLRRPTTEFIHPGDSAAITRLGVRNAARNPTRSLLTASLLASAAFLLVAVESFRRSPERDFAEKSGGSGGFPLFAETDLPVYFDPSSSDGREDLLKALEKVYQTDQSTKKAKLAIAEKLFKETTIIPLRVKAGDDASCLNLYRPGRPRIIGVPQSLIDRGGFHFAGVEAKSPALRHNPWPLLDEVAEGDAIPVFAEQHTVQWMLKSDLGGTIEITDGRGLPVKVRFVGLLQDSVFQGELLMSDKQFLRLFPRQGGFSVFLLDPPPEQRQDIRTLFQTALDSNGITITPATERLAAYLAVENTYLTTFQVLGGFGLLLGACGLAVVLLRNVWERRGELALLRALGYRRRTLGWMVFSENAALLLSGLAAGVVSALAAVTPHVVLGDGSIPWLRLAILLGFVLAVGFAAGGSAVRSTVRAPLVPALRKE